jgi:hypothetical protein
MKAPRLIVSLTLALLAIAAFAQNDTLRFIVTGDGRSDGENSKRPQDKNGINVVALKALVGAITQEKPKFVMYSGDLVMGYTTEATYRSQLKDWVTIMDPVYDAGIKVYVVRGNHDSSSDNAARVWQDTFQGKYAMDVVSAPGQDSMTYYKPIGNTLIVGLDEFANAKDLKHPVIDLDRLKQVLDAQKRTHLFLVGHDMAFKCAVHPDNLDWDTDARDKFIKLIWSHGGRTFFAGHDHVYDHMEIRDQAVEHPAIDFHQFVIGTAGAPFYDGDAYDGHNGKWVLRHVHHTQFAIGYMLVEINGNDVTMTWKVQNAAGKFVPEEVFSYSVPR